MSIAAIAFTDCGMALGGRLRAAFPDTEVTRCPRGGLAAWVENTFHSHEALVFIGAAGIAVRAIAPHVKAKTEDPAVVVIDETGTFAVPILSGHLGGANDLALSLARALGALPVVTTATDRHGRFAVDSWARRQGLQVVNPHRIKWISARILAGETVRLKSLYPIGGEAPAQVVFADEDYDILVSHRSRGRTEALRLVPKCVTAGIGCRRGTPSASVAAAVEEALRKSGCHPAALSAAASIDLKADEPGLLAFCSERGLPLRTFTAGELQNVPGEFTSSAFVRKTTGVDNVCERAAVLAGGGRLISRKEAMNGVTVALALTEPILQFDNIAETGAKPSCGSEEEL